MLQERVVFQNQSQNFRILAVQNAKVGWYYLFGARCRALYRACSLFAVIPWSPMPHVPTPTMPLLPLGVLKIDFSV